MNLREYLKRPVPPPDDNAARSTLRRALDAGKIQQVRFNYYYAWKWFDRLGNRWTAHDVYVHLAINLARKADEFQGKDRDPVAIRDAAKILRQIAAVAERRADILDSRADRLEGQDSETEAAD